MVIEKGSRGTLERFRDLSRIMKWSERSKPFSVELSMVGSLTRPGRRMPEACRARCSLYTGP
jgi:hypothetical protein